jgi:CheY-like chemotaxis protein
LTKELVKAMGGDISVESEVGKGTTFTVRLPITNIGATLAVAHPTVAPAEEVVAPSQAGRPQGSPLPPANNDSPSILLIEDNPDVVEYLAACLKETYDLDFAYNGRAGIEKALETIPDLIISDVMMPEKDGFEVCDFLKNDERTSHIPIVLLTAKADVESRIAGLKRGADAYLAKPFHQEELLVTLANLLELRRKLQARYSILEMDGSVGSPSLNP